MDSKPNQQQQLSNQMFAKKTSVCIQWKQLPLTSVVAEGYRCLRPREPAPATGNEAKAIGQDVIIYQSVLLYDKDLHRNSCAVSCHKAAQ